MSGTVSGNVFLNNSGVSASTYTYSTVTVNAKGIVTSASSGTAPTNYWNNAGSYIYPNMPSVNSNIQINGPSVAIYANNSSNTAIRADNSSASYVAFYAYNTSSGSCNAARIEGASTSGFPALWCYNPNGPGLTVQGAGTGYYHTYLNGGSSSNPALGVNGYFTATGSKSCILKTSQGYELMFSTEAPDVEFYTRGTGQLKDGIATIAFERLFREGISDSKPVQVNITPVGSWSGIYVVEQTQKGFTVKAENGDLNAKFNWTAAGIRKGYETRPVLLPSLYPPDDNAPMPKPGTTEGGGGRFK
jgi:hypothetical protein